MKKPLYGLQELQPDERDFSLGGFDPLPPLDELPEEFILPHTVKDQKKTDWCTAFASCAVSEVQEGVILEPAYSFAGSKEITGDIDAWGQNLRDACKSHVKFGAVQTAHVPEHIQKSTDKEKRDFELWKSLTPLALNHKKKSYFAITGQYDDANNIIASLYKYKTPIMIGIKFGYPLNQVNLEKPLDKGFGHAMCCIGYKQYNGDTHLLVLNSYGEKAGHKGLHFVSKEVINHFVPKFGAYTFIDADPEDVKYKQHHNIYASDNWIVQLWKILLNMLRLR